MVTPTRLTRWLPTAAVLALVISPAPAGADETAAEPCHLAGTIDPGRAVQAELRIGKEAIQGTLDGAESDRSLALDGTVLADGRVDLNVRGDFDRLVGTIHGTLGPAGALGGRAIIGEWRDADGRNPRPLDLEEVARYVTLRGRRGDELDVSCRYPFLLGGAPEVAEVNRKVAAEAMDWLQHALGAEPGSPAPRGLRYEDTLVYDSPRLVSRLVRLVTERSAAPLEVRYRAENLRVANGHVAPLLLGELFRAGSGYQQTLSTRAMEELRRVVAPPRVSGALALLREEDLQTFTISPSALQFVVPAARAGTPGPDDVLVSVPLRSISGLLEPGGPLGETRTAGR